MKFLILIVPVLMLSSCHTGSLAIEDKQFKLVDEKDYAKFVSPLLTPSGDVWSRTHKTDSGNPVVIKYLEAMQYCSSIAARLPTKEDYLKLLDDIKNQPNTATYRPYDKESFRALGHRGFYWTSTKKEDGSIFIFDFHRDSWESDKDVSHGVLCVTSPR